MKIYKITKGQLWVLWIGTAIFIGFVTGIDTYSEPVFSEIGKILGIFVTLILVFYTIGWRNSNKAIYNKIDKTIFLIILSTVVLMFFLAPLL